MNRVPFAFIAIGKRMIFNNKIEMMGRLFFNAKTKVLATKCLHNTEKDTAKGIFSLPAKKHCCFALGDEFIF